jgi:RNA polymerase sigma-70 factor (ECF subfamily)
MLYALAELSYSEVAQVLRVPLGTVRSRIHRARAALRELLKAEEAMNRYTD